MAKKDKKVPMLDEEQIAQDSLAEGKILADEIAKNKIEPKIESKELSNVSVEDAKKKVGDNEVFGEDVWVLLAKSSSKKQGWVKSTKAMQIGTGERGSVGGVVVQVSTQQGDNVAEAVTFIANAKIIKRPNGTSYIG